MDPVSAYTSASLPWVTDFGDQIFELAGCPLEGGLPVGWTAEVETPPIHGTVELGSPAVYTWRFTANAGAPGGGSPDSWGFKVTDANGAVMRLTVPVELYSVDN